MLKVIGIPKRTLNAWRKEALLEINMLEGWDSIPERSEDIRTMAKRILELTQVITDMYLLREAEAAEMVLIKKMEEERDGS